MIHRSVFTVGNHSREKLFDYGVIQTDQYIPERNWVKMSFCYPLRDPKELSRVTALVLDRFSQFDAKLVVDPLTDGAAWFMYGGVYETGAPFASAITVGANKARALFESLVSHGEMSEEERQNCDDAVQRLDRAYARSLRVNDALSLAQKTCIQSRIRPYLLAFSEGCSTLQRYEAVRRHSRCVEAMKYYAKLLLDPPPVLGSMRNSLQTLLHKQFFPLYGEGTKSEKYYDAMNAIAHVYAGLANLEGELDRLGGTVPSLPAVQDAVDELL